VCAAPLRIPYDPFPDLVERLAGSLDAADPEALVRYGQTLVTLVPGLRRLAALGRAMPYEAWILQFLFGGNQTGLRDFFRGRNVTAHVVADLVRLVLDAAESPAFGPERPLLLTLEQGEAIDPPALDILGHLARRLGGLPCALCCVVSRPGEGSGPAVVALAERCGWEIFRVTGEAGEELAGLLGGCGATARDLLRLVAVHGKPLPAAGLERLLAPADLSRAREELGRLPLVPLIEDEAGALWAPSAVRGAVLEPEGLEERAAIHRWLAAALEGISSPAEIAWHLRQAEAPAGLLSLEAMKWCWRVSAYDAALAHAEIAAADPEAKAWFSPRVLAALLSYEAGRFTEADQIFSELFSKAQQEPLRIALLRLAGYVKIFGIHDYEAGLRQLDETIPFYQERQRPSDLANTYNSMAFAALKLGRRDEALELESLALAEAAKLDPPDPLLETVTHLNLGRLYRSADGESAVTHIRQAIQANEGMMTPPLALMFYSTLGDAHWIRGDLPAALCCFHRCVNLSLDVDMVGWSVPVRMQIAEEFHRELGRRDPAAALFPEFARLLLHFNLGRAYQRAGYPDRARLYREHIAGEFEGWEEPALAAAVRDLLSAPAPEATCRATPEQPGIPALLGLLEPVAAESWQSGVVEALKRGEAVAWSNPDPELEEAGVRDELVLFDPRSRALATRVRRDLRRWTRGGAVLILPELGDWFTGRILDGSIAVQEATLKVEARRVLPGIFPVRTRIQVFSALAGSRDLLAVLQGWRNRTGLGALGAFSLRVAGEGLADARNAVKIFLETSLDLLALDGQLLRKARGPLASENLLELKPRLIQPVYGGRNPEVGDDSAGYVATHRLQLKMGSAGFSLVEGIDGKRTVAELLGTKAEGETDEGVAFLRTLRRYGVIGFSV
jgi:tetratricopeptide (TPR) repeat protein